MPTGIACRWATVEAAVEQFAGLRGLAAAHQGEQQHVLHHLALGAAAADAHHLGGDRLQDTGAAGVIVARERQGGAADFRDNRTGGQGSTALAESAQRLASEVDHTFAEVSLPKLKDELLALRLEMVGTAWTDASKESPALANSAFTKEYLANLRRSDLWEVMREYNQMVARAATYNADPKTRIGRGTIAFVNTLRANVFDKLYAQGHDPDSVARVVNRMGVRRIDTVYALLASRLIGRVDFHGSDGVVIPLAAVACGFYQGAKEALKGVRLTA